MVILYYDCIIKIIFFLYEVDIFIRIDKVSNIFQCKFKEYFIYYIFNDQLFFLFKGFIKKYFKWE